MILDILSIGSKIIDKVFPDAGAAEQAKLKLLELQQSGQRAQLNADIAEQQEVTKRWTADMTSDSWLSKNIRPMTLLIILGGYFTFALMSAFDFDTHKQYVELLGNWGIIVMTAYFGGRTVEKVMDMKAKNSEKEK